MRKGVRVLVGSGKLADLRLDSPEIGAAHVRVEWDDSGVCITDNGSQTGTFVNGEAVETAELLDGDRISFVPPDDKAKKRVPRLLVRIPPGSVLALPPSAEPSPPSSRPPAPEPLTAPPLDIAPARREAGAGEAPAPERPHLPPHRERPPEARPRPSAPAFKLSLAQLRLDRLPLPRMRLDPLRVGIALAALVLLLGLVLLVQRFLSGGAPQLAGTQPAVAEAGQTLVISGKRFDPDPARDTVWFGDQTAAATSATEGTVSVVVPSLSAGGSVPLAVETPRGRSAPLSLTVRTPLRVNSFEPEAALPGEEVSALGQGFQDGPARVSVAGKTAQILEASPTRLRFKVPDLALEPGVPAPVVVGVGSATALPRELLLGHLPYLLEVSPARGGVGELVTLKGRGFAPDPAANAVTFGGAPALVLSATERELRVVAPAVPGTQVHSEAPVVVTTRGRASVNRAVFTLQRSSGAFVLRFFGTAVGGSPGQAFVASEVGPLLLLASPDEAPSLPERALRVSASLNEVADGIRAGRPAVLEARELPVPGVAVAGGGTLLVKATAEDASAYGAPPGLGAKVASPSLRALAAHWTALLNDYLTLFVENERPLRLLAESPRGSVMADLGSALGWRPGLSVPSERVVNLTPDLLRRLRELALLVPGEGQAQAAAALAGTWEGEMTEEATKSIVVRLRLEGTQLLGSLTTTTGGVAMDVPLKDVSYEKGVLRFVLPAGASARTFVGRLEGGSMSGTLHASPPGPPLGRFSLKYSP